MPVVCNGYLLHYKITIEIVSLEPVMFAAALAFLVGISPAPPPPIVKFARISSGTRASLLGPETSLSVTRKGEGDDRISIMRYPVLGERERSGNIRTYYRHI
jgi:hypothetical protein